MKGSTIDSMSEAVDGAEVVLFGVSLDYKESANCRLEANYAMEMQLDMIPVPQPTLSLKFSRSETVPLKWRWPSS